MSEAVVLSLDNGIADLRLNRPEKMNAIDEGIMTGLRQSLENIRQNPSVRCVVISGNGKGFCAGLDFSNFGDMLSGELTAEGVAEAYEDLSPAGANQVQQLGWGWQELSVPVIAAVHGAALGGGLNVALGADIRIVHPETKMGFVEIGFGLLPDMSATQSLRRLASLDRIKELIFTGRKFTGRQALDYGLATELSDTPLEAAMEMARAIAGRNPDAVRKAKELLNQSALVDVRDGLIAESNCSRTMMGTPNQLEAVMASLEKRQPVFADT
ncbi:MAG: crotonase/enoyl-CoA hydratase family protein [Halioglobus sp.]